MLLSMSMRHRVWVTCIVVASLAAAAPVFAQAWRAIPGARGLARPGAPHVTLEVRANSGFACGGGGCNGGVEARNVHGQLPGTDLAFFYSDRPGNEPGCPPAANRESFLAEWTQVEIAPSREEHVACGIGVMVGDRMEEWVILRARRVIGDR